MTVVSILLVACGWLRAIDWGAAICAHVVWATVLCISLLSVGNWAFDGGSAIRARVMCGWCAQHSPCFLQQCCNQEGHNTLFFALHIWWIACYDVMCFRYQIVWNFPFCIYHDSLIPGVLYSYSWQFDFVEAPLRPSTTLNYQAATRFIEHSLPDLTPGKVFIYPLCQDCEFFNTLILFHSGIADLIQIRSEVWETLVEERGQTLSI